MGKQIESMPTLKKALFPISFVLICPLKNLFASIFHQARVYKKEIEEKKNPRYPLCYSRSFQMHTGECFSCGFNLLCKPWENVSSPPRLVSGDVKVVDLLN